MIRRRDPGNFGTYVMVTPTVGISEGIPARFLDQIAGPVIISALLFFAILANFVLRGALPPLHLMVVPLNVSRSFSSRTVRPVPFLRVFLASI